MASYAHYVLQKLHILPSVFCDLSAEEQAFIIASVDLQIEKKKRDARELEHKIGHSKGKG